MLEMKGREGREIGLIVRCVGLRQGFGSCYLQHFG